MKKGHQKDNLLYRKAERKLFQLQAALVSPEAAPEETLRSAQLWFQPRHFEEVVEERAVEGICGYPICGNEVNPCNNDEPKFRINYNEKKVFEVTESRKYCSISCLELSSKFLMSLDGSVPASRPIAQSLLSSAEDMDVQGIDTILEILSSGDSSQITPESSKLSQNEKLGIPVPIYSNPLMAVGGKVTSVDDTGKQVIDHIEKKVYREEPRMQTAYADKRGLIIANPSRSIDGKSGKPIKMGKAIVEEGGLRVMGGSSTGSTAESGIISTTAHGNMPIHSGATDSVRHPSSEMKSLQVRKHKKLPAQDLKATATASKQQAITASLELLTSKYSELGGPVVGTSATNKEVFHPSMLPVFHPSGQSTGLHGSLAGQSALSSLGIDNSDTGTSIEKVIDYGGDNSATSSVAASGSKGQRGGLVLGPKRLASISSAELSPSSSPPKPSDSNSSSALARMLVDVPTGAGSQPQAGDGAAAAAALAGLVIKAGLGSRTCSMRVDSTLPTLHEEGSPDPSTATGGSITAASMTERPIGHKKSSRSIMSPGAGLLRNASSGFMSPTPTKILSPLNRSAGSTPQNWGSAKSLRQGFSWREEGDELSTAVSVSAESLVGLLGATVVETDEMSVVEDGGTPAAVLKSLEVAAVSGRNGLTPAANVGGSGFREVCTIPSRPAQAMSCVSLP